MRKRPGEEAFRVSFKFPRRGWEQRLANFNGFSSVETRSYYSCLVLYFHDQTLLNLHPKATSLITACFLFSFKLKIILNYCSRCVSIRFLERIDSYPIRLVSLSESKGSNPFSLQKPCQNKYVPIETDKIAIQYDGNIE